MAYGACLDCGCNYGECECPIHHTAQSQHATYEDPMIPSHGTYLRDYPSFEKIKNLSPREAFDLLKDSAYVKGAPKLKWPGAIEFVKNGGLVNKGWAITAIDKTKNTIDVVYNQDGSYLLYRGSLVQFIKVTQPQCSYYPEMQAIHDTVAEPETP